MRWGRGIGIVGVVIGVEIVIIAAVGLIVVYGGYYNVAATSKDPAWMDSLLGAISDHSIEHHAAGIPVSPTFEKPDLEVGYDHYSEMCVMCHGAPGVEAGDAAQGLNPQPPHLYETVGDLSPSEVFWILKHGIKMTGMPAFGPTHDDEKLWNIAAFVKKLPGMTPEQYAQMGKAPAMRMKMEQ
jgi:mono/diheme cytochrome c family protein